MSLFDFFFPEQAQAAHLRRLADGSRVSRRTQRQQSSSVQDLRKRVDTLEQDLGYVALVLGALVARVDEKGLVTRTELKEIMSELDEIDGVGDGKLDVNVLKGMQR